MIQSLILTVRTLTYYEILMEYMNSKLVKTIWAWLGHPVPEDPDEQAIRWEHPAWPYMVFIIRLLQIHVESIMLSGITYWMPTTALPPVALKPVYLPIFMQERPIYDSSASQWVSDMWVRLPREILLSAFLLNLALAIDTHRQASWPHSEHAPRRYMAFSYLFNDLGSRVLSQSVYQVFYPMFVLLRPLCGLQLIPLLNGTTLIRETAARQKSTGYAVLDIVVLAITTFFGPRNLWPAVYSILLLIFGAVIWIGVFVSLLLLLQFWCFSMYLIIIWVDWFFNGGQLTYAIWIDGGFMSTLPVTHGEPAAPIFGIDQFLFRDAVPYPRLYQPHIDHFLLKLAPDEQELEFRYQMAFNVRRGLEY
ncbi:hypothetical protein PG996_006051 [Apiospora saccharicola]|uniref:Uncharacterized protein n=1 Tax=Apiospora saccharicola TaxID=335842 RepID=A0ABR1VN74_9PEZI